MLKGYKYSIKVLNFGTRLRKTTEFGLIFPELKNLAVTIVNGKIECGYFSDTSELHLSKPLMVSEELVMKFQRLADAQLEVTKEVNSLRMLIAH